VHEEERGERREGRGREWGRRGGKGIAGGGEGEGGQKRRTKDKETRQAK